MASLDPSGIISDIFSITPTGMVATAAGELLGPTVLAASDQAADLDAIHAFISNAKILTFKAQEDKDNWMRWFGGLTWFQKNTDTNIGAEGFNRRNQFMRDNVSTPEERKKVDDFVKQVPAFDPVTGKPNFVDSKGDRVLQPEPLIPTPYKVAGVIGAAAVAALVVLKKLTIL